MLLLTLREPSLRKLSDALVTDPGLRLGGLGEAVKLSPWLNSFDVPRGVAAESILENEAEPGGRGAFTLVAFESVIQNFETRSFDPLRLEFAKFSFQLHTKPTALRDCAREALVRWMMLKGILSR